MKRLLTILGIIVFSLMVRSQQSNDPYEALWEKVEKLEREALTKSAREVVRSISAKAKKEQNTPQIVKSLLYSSKYAMILDEEGQLAVIDDFTTQIEQSKFPAKNILESYLAHLYWQYFQQNRYQFYNRTKTETKVNGSDFRTWDLTTLFEEIRLHFDRSLENPEKLQALKTTDFHDILVEQPNSGLYRPTLFDVLAHTALEFYKSDEIYITRPADKFEINAPELLNDTYTFIHQKIDTSDHTSLQSKALHIYQQLLQFHYPEPQLDAFVEVDIERLRYILDKATFEKKEARYLEILQNAAQQLAHHEVSALYQYEIAALYRKRANTYRPKTHEEHRWKQKEAHELCEAIIGNFPNSRAAEKSLALKSEILDKRLNLTTERHIPIGKPARLLVDYANHDAIQLTAYDITQSQLKQLNRLHPESKKRAFIGTLHLNKTWEAQLHNEGDYQPHKTEISVPPLTHGQYLIFAAPKNDSDTTFTYSPVQVTDLALVEMKTPAHHNFQVINRNNGQPVPEAKVTFTYRENYNGKDIEKTKVTDDMGMVKITPGAHNWTNVRTLITTNNDKGHFGNYYIDQDVDQDRPKSTHVSFLFTDRSIYRPGQPVYFKGIAIHRNGDVSSVLTNTSVSVTLRDVNAQEIGRQEFNTNEFGSFSGEFMLPNGGLTGNFTLEAFSDTLGLHGSTQFSVEEYKRPKFETSFEPISKTFRLNDTVSVEGSANSYAGSAITGAKVTYRVQRTVSFPRWYFWSRPILATPSQEIAHGQTVTDASGNYSIDFKAIPDNKVSKKDLPTFSYEVTADVTDINGETHSTTTMVRLGYHALTAHIGVAETLDRDEKNAQIEISTKNLNGQYIASTGTLKMYKLKDPGYVLRSRPWSSPDYKGFSKKAFKALYPHDAYDNEHDPNTWEKGKLVWEIDFDTKKSTKISLPTLKKWASGRYIIELETRDAFEQVVKDHSHTVLFHHDDKKLADHQLFQIKTDKATYDIGDQVEISVMSASKNLTVSIFVEKDQKIIASRQLTLSNSSERFTIPVDSEDVGGFSVNYSFSAYNSFQSGTLPIAVPYPDTDLEIETLTFRDKLRPGTEERWTFKIKGSKGEQVSAEIMANMYDASLDAFRGHEWHFDPKQLTEYRSNIYSSAYRSFGINGFRVYTSERGFPRGTSQAYDSFNWFGFHFGHGRTYNAMMVRKSVGAAPAPAMEVMEDEESLDETVIIGYGEQLQNSATEGASEVKPNTPESVPIRKNLQETAFFFPQMQTDEEGHVSFSFTTPEALTRWKLQLLAHTKSLHRNLSTLETVTQKELMVIPNVPRFLREGDEVVLSTKIANLTDQPLSGQVRLLLVDALTGRDISTKLLDLPASTKKNTDQSSIGTSSFTVDSLGNTQVSWALKIPEEIQAVEYTLMATAGDYSDGEQGVLPVLTNRMLVTETLPMWVGAEQNKTFVLDNLKNTASSTLKHHKLSLEITSNPAWHAVQALPYLMEYPYDCNEQIFSRYYANTLSSHIVHSNRRIEQVFDQWRNSDALESNLEKNQELKSLLITETPWLRDAQSETEQKKRIALLFDLNKMKSERANSLAQLKQNQMSSGAWAWFNGGRENRFITQHIITGLGHLAKLTSPMANISNQGNTQRDMVLGEERAMIERAIQYLDTEFVEDYERMKAHASNINDDHLSAIQIHYLYMRSFYKGIATNEKINEIMAYYHAQVEKYWTKKSLYSKGLLALIFHRSGNTERAQRILRSLKENSISSEELGTYWKENTASWYWHQAPIETQALLIEAFSEVGNDNEMVDRLKIWLLKHKQTNQWETTKATADAVYALLLEGSEWLSIGDAVQVTVGGQEIEPARIENAKIEAGTVYFKTSWSANEIDPRMAEVKLTQKGKHIAWGALYWQYFEDLDKITTSETGLTLRKKLFLRKLTETGETLSNINDTTTLEVGDLIRVRIELTSDREMEFVHMKDMRGAGMEPVNVLSKYTWQDGLGYYESTKDSSTHFFFDTLPKGTFVFEYDLRVNHAGNFSNGITSIQSMYAPEFSSHSGGSKVRVEP